MTVGFTVYNDSNTIQIDESYSNFVLTKKGTVTLTLDTGTHPQPVYYANFSFTAQSPIIAFATPSGNAGYLVGIMRVVNSGNNWTVYLRSRYNGAYNVTYYVFDDPSMAPAVTDNFGLQVMKGDGSTAFHSSMKPMRIAGLIPVANPTNGGTGTDLETGALGDDISTPSSVTLPSGKVYAVAPQGSAFMETLKRSLNQLNVPVGQKRMTYRAYMGAVGTDGNVCRSGAVGFENYDNLYANGTSEFVNCYGDLSSFVLDVTNY